MVEEGNFVSRERLLSCTRGTDILVPFDTLFLGLDWGRVSDQTIATVGNDENDVLEWFAHPDEPDARDDYPDSTALMVTKAASSKIGVILFG